MSIKEVFGNHQKELHDLRLMVRELRRYTAITQKEFAKDIGLHRNTLRQIKQGKV